MSFYIAAHCRKIYNSEFGAHYRYIINKRYNENIIFNLFNRWSKIKNVVVTCHTLFLTCNILYHI
ncbi:hypothetical protein HanIR_Chr07g0302831 [Helianthus annuus]|nr:hypothetical protein HanIR_Chr07g0302831 [Helianthus annuus]